jgi:hypothetical protein
MANAEIKSFGLDKTTVGNSETMNVSSDFKLLSILDILSTPLRHRIGCLLDKAVSETTNR